MKCPEEEILSIYVDKEINREMEGAVEEHLKSCERCKRIVKKFDRLNVILRDLRKKEQDKFEIEFLEDIATLNDKQLITFFEATTISNPPIGYLDRLLDKLKETPYRVLWSDGAKALDNLKRIIKPVQTLVKFVSPLQYEFDTSDTSEMDEIRERIGAEFQQNIINLKLYSGKLYVLSRNSALFKFGKGDKPTSNLDGKPIEFYLIEKPSNLLSETIQEGKVVIDFTKLGISIEEYAKVGFKIYLDEATVIDGRFSNVSGESKSS